MGEVESVCPAGCGLRYLWTRLVFKSVFLAVINFLVQQNVIMVSKNTKDTRKP